MKVGKRQNCESLTRTPCHHKTRRLVVCRVSGNWPVAVSWPVVCGRRTPGQSKCMNEVERRAGVSVPGGRTPVAEGVPFPNSIKKSTNRVQSCLLSPIFFLFRHRNWTKLLSPGRRGPVRWACRGQDHELSRAALRSGLSVGGFPCFVCTNDGFGGGFCLGRIFEPISTAGPVDGAE